MKVFSSIAEGTSRCWARLLSRFKSTKSAPVLQENAIYKVRLDQGVLNSITPAERAAFVKLGYAANQIALFQKLIVFSSNKEPEDQVEQQLSAAQTQMLARIAIGVIHEAWLAVEKSFLQQPLGKDYLPLIGGEGRDALGRLKRQFGGSNLLNLLRNNYAFHHPSDADVEAAFQSATNNPAWNDHWNWYMANSTLNFFYFSSDLVMLHGMLSAVGEVDLIAAQHKIMAEVRSASDSLTEFIGAFSSAFWRKNFGPEIEAVICADVSNAPKLFELWLPFFTKR